MFDRRILRSIQSTRRARQIYWVIYPLIVVLTMLALFRSGFITLEILKIPTEDIDWKDSLKSQLCLIPICSVRILPVEKVISLFVSIGCCGYFSSLLALYSSQIGAYTRGWRQLSQNSEWPAHHLSPVFQYKGKIFWFSEIPLWKMLFELGEF